MKSAHASFRSTTDPAHARLLLQQLEEAGLDASLQENSATFDVTFTAGLEREFHVMLPPEQFMQAELVLEEEAQADADALPADHYLHAFSDEELLEVLRKPDEWAPHDRILAKRLLQQRGVRVDPGEMARMQQARLAELALPEKARFMLIVAGIVMVLFGGVVGMLIGYSLSQGRKTLPDGRRVPRYTAADRRTGVRLMVAGAVFSLITLLLSYCYWPIGWTELYF